MKSLVFILLSSFFCITASARKPMICEITMDNGRFDFLYDRIIAMPGSVGVGSASVDCFWMFCNDPGWRRCRFNNATVTGGVFLPMDNTDHQNFDALMTFGEDEISKGNLSGSHSVKVSVAGESVLRSYTVQWRVNTSGAVEMKLTFTEV